MLYPRPAYMAAFFTSSSRQNPTDYLLNLATRNLEWAQESKTLKSLEAGNPRKPQKCNTLPAPSTYKKHWFLHRWGALAINHRAGTTPVSAESRVRKWKPSWRVWPRATVAPDSLTQPASAPPPPPHSTLFLQFHLHKPTYLLCYPSRFGS